MHSVLADQLLKFAQDAFLVVDADGSITYANDAVTTLFGYRPADLTGLALEHLLPHGPRVGSHLVDALNPESWADLSLARRRDGSEFTSAIRVQPLEIGSRLQIIVVVRDASEREQLLEELALLRTEVDQSLSVTEALLQTLGHDLRQPLQALQSLTDLLKRRAENPSFAEVAEKLDSVLVHLKELLDERLPYKSPLVYAIGANEESNRQRLSRYNPESVSAG